MLHVHLLAGEMTPAGGSSVILNGFFIQTSAGNYKGCQFSLKFLASE